jgi:hypothetical protein
MDEAFESVKQSFAREIKSELPGAARPLMADPWIVSGVLQKSIRRGETELVQRAALTLLTLKASALWRRLMVIASEDIGAGSEDLLAVTVAAATDGDWRQSVGGDERVAMFLARRLAEAPKDRSADYLICGAKDHPAKEAGRSACRGARLSRMCEPLRIRAFPCRIAQWPPGLRAALNGRARAGYLPPGGV